MGNLKKCSFRKPTKSFFRRLSKKSNKARSEITPTLLSKILCIYSSIDSYASTRSRSSLMPPASSSARLICVPSSGSLSMNHQKEGECAGTVDEQKQRLTAEYHRLKAKLKAIEDELLGQLNELKSVCLEEAVSGRIFCYQYFIVLNVMLCQTSMEKNQVFARF